MKPHISKPFAFSGKFVLYNYTVLYVTILLWNINQLAMLRKMFSLLPKANFYKRQRAGKCERRFTTVLKVLALNVSFKSSSVNVFGIMTKILVSSSSSTSLWLPDDLDWAMNT